MMDHIRIQLREANIQVKQSFPKERIEGQPESLSEVVLVESNVPGGRSSRLVSRPQELKLHVIRDLIHILYQLQLSLIYLGRMSIDLELSDWLGDILSPWDCVSVLFPNTLFSGMTPVRPRFEPTTLARHNRSVDLCENVPRCRRGLLISLGWLNSRRSGL